MQSNFDFSMSPTYTEKEIDNLCEENKENISQDDV
jgi:hypothetical protein